MKKTVLIITAIIAVLIALAIILQKETEKELYLLEGKVNSLFHQYGYHVDTFIVESSDALEIPRQYQVLYE